MKVLVTGGGGYLGSWVVRKLVEQGRQVRVFDRFCFGQEALSDLDDLAQCEIVSGDIRRLQESPGLFDGIDGVIHLASLSNDPSCNLDTEMAMDINVESTVELARKAMDAGVRRFVLASSCAVYGRGLFELLDEQSPLNPVSTFGQAKRDAEEALLEMAGDEFEPVVSRMATTFGWSSRMRFDLAVNLMVAWAVRRGCITVNGGGGQWRPFVHVQDAARALVLLLEAPSDLVKGEIFNTGSDLYNTRILDLAKRVSRHFEGVRVDVPTEDDELRNYRVQFSKIRDRLGFVCEWSIDEGIEEIRQHLEGSDLDPFSSLYSNVERMKSLLATPVDQGGEPVAARFIPLSKPSLGVEEESAVLKAFRSGWLTSGPQVQAFERAFAKHVNAPYAVGCSSCTSALHLSLIRMGVEPGDEVITSPITWVSTANTVENMGAKLVFCDVDPVTLNMDPASLEAAIGPRTKAIMPVHMAGLPCDIDAIYAVAARHGVPVVEDAAHALGAKYKGKNIGECARFSCFSFYAIKNITTMEGGMISCTDQEDAEAIRLLAGNGLEASAWDRYGRSAVPTPLEVVAPGYKYAMGNVSAAIGLEQLKKFPAFLEARKRLAKMYLTVLQDLDEIELPPVSEGLDSAWHLFVIQFKLDKLNRDRNELAYDLRRENIGSGFHFYGLHLHKYYREKYGLKPEDFPSATQVSNQVLSLPLHPQLSAKNLHEVVQALKKVLYHARKSH